MSELQILCVTVGALQTNCYILFLKERHDCVVVDPGADAEEIMAVLDKADKTAAAVLLTHGHFDHTAALYAFSDKDIYMNAGDDFMLDNPDMNVGGRFYDTAKRPQATKHVRSGDVFSLAGMTFSVIETPGHTPGGVCYLVNDELMLTGDTLFHHAVGRVDHPGGDFSTLLRSVQKLLAMDRDYPIYPGHGASSTLFAERDNI